jgi:hypothetical protein
MKRFALISTLYLLTCTPLGADFGNEKLLLSLDGAENDFFGQSVSISGDTAIVGAPQDDDTGSGPGSAYVYVRNPATSLWTEQQKLLASDGADGDLFGYSVSISGDTVIVGAYGNDDDGTNRGSVYIFVRNAGTWTEQQKLLNSNGQVNDWFGLSVSISGDTVAVSAEGEDDNGSQSGAAFIYVRNGITWTEQQKLLPSDNQTNSYFGHAVAISGDTVVIGKYLFSTAGSAYVFVRNPITPMWTEQQKLVASDALTSNGGHFGSSVAISNDTIIIGAPFDYPDLDGVVGSAYVYLRSGILWAEQQKLRASDLILGEVFGFSVSVSNDTAVVGAVGYISSNNYNGASHIFTRSSVTWSEQNITASDGAINDQYGHSVSVSGDNIIVGAPQDDNNGTDSGSAYAYTPSDVIFSSSFEDP